MFESNSIFDDTDSRLQSYIIPALYLNDALYSEFCQEDLPVHSYITRNNHAPCFSLRWTLKFRSAENLRIFVQTVCYFETLIIKLTHHPVSKGSSTLELFSSIINVYSYNWEKTQFTVKIKLRCSLFFISLFVQYISGLMKNSQK